MGRAIVAIAAKDVRLLLRDKGGAFVAFVFPLIYCVFFGVIFSARSTSDNALDIVVADEDRTEPSTAFAAKLEASQEFNVTRATRDEARDLVRRGKQTAYVVLDKGFGDAVETILLNKHPRIEIGVDPSHQAEAAMVEGILTKYAFEMIVGTLSNPKMMSQQVNAARKMIQSDERLGMVQRTVLDRFFAELDRFVEQTADSNGQQRTADDTAPVGDEALANWRPVDIAVAEVTREHEGPSNSYDISFPQGIIWGVLGCCASFGISLVIERTSGTLARLRVAPIGRGQILAGKALACFGCTFLLSVVLFLFGWLVFDVVPYSVVNLGVSLVMIALAFVGIMMFLSILGKTERSVSGISWAVLLGMAMIGGGMVPRFFMPPWMQMLSHFSPVKWAILAMEGAVWRDFSTREMLVPWIVLLLVGVAFFAIGLRGFNWMHDD